jgi:hypothetical protein
MTDVASPVSRAVNDNLLEAAGVVTLMPVEQVFFQLPNTSLTLRGRQGCLAVLSTISSALLVKWRHCGQPSVDSTHVAKLVPH